MRQGVRYHAATKDGVLSPVIANVGPTMRPGKWFETEPLSQLTGFARLI